jgi:hypothetical protein
LDYKKNKGLTVLSTLDYAINGCKNFSGDRSDNLFGPDLRLLSCVRKTQGKCEHETELKLFINISKDYHPFQSLKIADQINNSNFMRADKSLKKSLMLITLISSKPKRLSALHFFNLDMTSYTTVNIPF